MQGKREDISSHWATELEGMNERTKSPEKVLVSWRNPMGTSGGRSEHPCHFVSGRWKLARQFGQRNARGKKVCLVSSRLVLANVQIRGGMKGARKVANPDKVLFKAS